MAPGEPAEFVMRARSCPTSNASALHVAGGTVVGIQRTIDAATHASWSNRFAPFSMEERRERMAAAFASGSFGHALWPGLDVLPADLKVPKHRFIPTVSPVRSQFVSLYGDCFLRYFRHWGSQG